MDKFDLWLKLSDSCGKNNYENIEPKMRLARLDEYANQFIGRTLSSLYNKSVKKCNVTHTKSLNHDKKEVMNNSIYGHLKCGNTFFRLSTCLKLYSQEIEIPISEEKYWNENTKLFFTDGKRFLIIPSNELDTRLARKTETKNYSFMLSSLFMLNKVEHFGKVIGTKLESDTKETLITRQRQRPRFTRRKIRGCVVSAKPKYCVVKLSGEKKFDFFTTVEAAFDYCKKYTTTSGSTFYQHAKFNGKSLQANKKPRMLKTKTGQFFIVSLKDTTEEDLMKYVDNLSASIEKTAEQKMVEHYEKPVSMTKAVKAIWPECKDTEEIRYYYNALLASVGKRFVTGYDVEVFRDFNQKLYIKPWSKNG